MKRILFMMLMLVMLSVNCFAISETAIILHHEGDVTVYEGPSQLTTALEAATDGDTLYLGVGAYPGFEITKKIYVKGAGDNQTQINGSISINIDSDIEDPVVYDEPILEGLYIPSDYIRLYQYTKGITIRKCNVKYFILASGTHNGLTVDRSDVSEFRYTEDMHELSIINSKIYYLNNNPNGNQAVTIRDDVSIINSNINEVQYCSFFEGSFINSIIGTSWGTSDYFEKGSFINTLYNSSRLTLKSTVNQQNCYIYGSSKYNSTAEELLEAGYLGTDGTVVGCYGGATPFTLSLSVPAVDETKSKLEVDNEAKKLKVSIILKNAPEEENTQN